MTQEKLQQLFSTFDVDGDGNISASNIKVAFTKFGIEASDEDVAEIMESLDQDNGQTISKEEFACIFK